MVQYSERSERRGWKSLSCKYCVVFCSLFVISSTEISVQKAALSPWSTLRHLRILKYVMPNWEMQSNKCISILLQLRDQMCPGLHTCIFWLRKWIIHSYTNGLRTLRCSAILTSCSVAAVWLLLSRLSSSSQFVIDVKLWRIVSM